MLLDRQHTSLCNSAASYELLHSPISSAYTHPNMQTTQNKNTTPSESVYWPGRHGADTLRTSKYLEMLEKTPGFTMHAAGKTPAPQTSVTTIPSGRTILLLVPA
eukprot:jgi/Ulvmu1/12530/UM090_0017.1